ncbi:SGNH/GDSL hydrolase family protein [Duganella phyllosphaerae]|uniref:Uncharacterized protein n=1 Tax=Duganella phyllosphaerae TaxID=762836 RepID=A0A1E7W645_9BURK|nr:SGNH/GDSL hydrolase family protein [Duganella phyllosphaerae]OEZ91453.1 hypothetical protein DUPY_50650 [Duganella phyllosphaerae]
MTAILIPPLSPFPGRGAAPEDYIAQADTTMQELPVVISKINEVSAAFNLGGSILSLGYLPPVPYAAGISLTVATQTVQYGVNTYAANVTALPFTTSGVFETDKFRLVQGVTSAQLAEPEAAGTIGFQQAGVDANGARVRKVKDRLREAVHVTDYPNVDPTGVTDSSLAIISARKASDTPYVPDGVFQLNQTGQLAGLWGDGEVEVGGQRVRLPASPRRLELVSSVMAKLIRLAFGAGTMVLVADSIGEGYIAWDIKHSWFNMLLRMINAYSSPEGGSEPEVTNLGDPNRYGLTYSGTYAVGPNGPIGKSLILQPGASVSFGGKFAYVDVMAQRSPGAGTLTMRRNGTPFRTLNMDAAAESDWCSFPSVTGSGAAPTDIYTLTVTGAPVELTGIWRLANTGQPGIFGSRCALSASSTQLHSQDARIASVIKHSRALNPSAKPLIFVALAINNANTDVPSAGTTPEVYGQQLGKMFARYINSGAYVVAIGGIQPGASWGVVRTNYPAIAEMQKRVCEQYGVPIISMDAYAWVREGGVLADDLHPNTPGNLLYLDIVLEFLASPAFDLAGGTQAHCLNRSDLPLSWYGTGEIAGTAALSNVRWSRSGPLVRVMGNLSGINPTAATAAGPLCIGMPTFSNTTMRGNGVVSSCKGFAGSTGKQWTLQTVGNGGNLAVLRSIDPVTGVESDVTSITAGASIDFDITYIEQD